MTTMTSFSSVLAMAILALLMVTNAGAALFIWPKDYVLSNTATLPQRPAVEGTFRIALDSSGNSITSPNANCALGFLDHNNSGNFTLSIVFIPFFSSPKGTEIWSANRNKPVGEKARVLRNTQGDLVLLDSDGTAVWSSGGSAESMDLGETGNWVLYNTSNSNLTNQGEDATVWSSWEHPTNTLMIGQIFRSGQKLVSNASPTDSSQGRFSLAAEKGGLVLYADSPQSSLPYWVWAFPGLSYQYIKNPCTSGSVISQAVYSANLIALGNIGNATVNNGSSSSCSPTAYSDTLPFHRFKGESRLRFVRLDSDGNLRAYMATPIRGIIGSNPQEWAVDYELFPSCFNCSLPSVCGPYGVCSNGQCSCPAAMFTMREAFQPEAGCSPPRPLNLNCSGKQKMVEVKGVDYYSNNYLSFSAATPSTSEQCKDSCLSKCDCVAAFFRSDLGSCLLTLERVDSMQLVAPNRRTIYTAFLKVQTS
ncbi:hypothetical protein KI387_041460 [Taxus chinensis]|uniref:Bulb-type lectin domain-containing protein n=1 Tax=Taxus chinensis TaxID=29808 RepID=A0AA38F8V3_TAXCH|nr:hypothetical protein KI387_041460 [Taxus chinensis]